MAKKRSWFAHTCWFCGLKSREVDFIAGDGVYQCHFPNWDVCHERHGKLDPVAYAALPKPYNDPTRDLSPKERAQRARVRERMSALGL